MTERVTRLREASLAAVETISTERAELLTAHDRECREPEPALRRALAFQYLLAHKAISIAPGELIVGERGPAPKATPTYPELCCHSLEDLDILDRRDKTRFAVPAAARQVYEREIIPYWRGRSMRDLLFRAMAPEWLAAYEAGMFTEFMEQRAPGHTVLGDKIYRMGFCDIQRDIDEHLGRLDYVRDPEAYAKSVQLRAMRICCDAIVGYARRHAALARELAQAEADERRRGELLRIAAVCERVPAGRPRDFWEALQAYWFVHLGVITELNTWDSFCPGRLDQHLEPYYRQGIEDGTLTRDSAEELLQCFWVKFNNQPAPPKVGVTAAESGTYTDFANINSGGLRADGSDGVNDVTYLVLDVIDEMRLLQPSSNVQVSKKNPDAFVRRAARIIRNGWGQPSVFNADAVVAELLRQGKSLEDARMGGTSGCVETGAFGKEAYILTGYLNLVKVLELALNRGLDPRTGRRLGPDTGDPAGWESFAELWEAYEQQLRHIVEIKVAGNNVVERLYATHMPAPFLSTVIDDCVAKGRDYHAGGARYDTSYIQGVGIGTLTDCLAAIRRHVFELRSVSMVELLAALAGDFAAGAEQADVRTLLGERSPKWGNDDDEADELMQLGFDAFYRAVNGRPNTRGGTYRINMLPTTCHVYFGSVTGATADGRRAWQPLSEGISPVQGRDRKGPTAVIRSCGKMDHLRTGGTLLNMKFTPSVLEGERGLDNLVHLVRAYFKLDGHHIQFNVVDAATLRAAQAEPDRYRDLIVRVAGYSDYFCDLSPALQEEIIARTAHETL